MRTIRENYIQSGRKTTAKVAGSEVKSIRRSSVVRTGLRIYDGSRIGTAGAIGSYDPQELGKRAMDSLACGIEYPWEPSGGISRHERVGLEGIDHDSLAPEADRFMVQIHRSWPDLVFSEFIAVEDASTTILNDMGLDLSTGLSFASALLAFRAMGSTNIMDGFLAAGPCRKWDSRGILQEFDQFLEAWHNPVDLSSTGRLPVIFPEEQKDTLFHKLASELSGHRYGTGASLFSGRVGKRIFSDDFSLVQGRIPTKDFTPFFDAEGVFHEDYTLPLIENGVLRAVCTDRRTAAHFSLPHTGSASGGYDSIPSAGADCIRVLPSTKTLAGLLGGEPGILVALTSGGDFTPDGAFAAPVQLAMLHDGSRFIGRLPEIRISSHLFKMFGDDWTGLSSDHLSAFAHTPAMVVRMEVEKASGGV